MEDKEDIVQKPYFLKSRKCRYVWVGKGFPPDSLGKDKEAAEAKYHQLMADASLKQAIKTDPGTVPVYAGSKNTASLPRLHGIGTTWFLLATSLALGSPLMNWNISTSMTLWTSLRQGQTKHRSWRDANHHQSPKLGLEATDFYAEPLGRH